MKILTELHGAPGFENDVRNYLKEEMAPFVDEFVQDRMGANVQNQLMPKE